MEISIKWNVCRVCLMEVDKTMMTCLYGDVKITKQIYECSGVTMEAGDYMPEKICRKCLLGLKYAVNFRTTCQRSHEYLQRVVQKTRSATSLFTLDRRREESMKQMDGVIDVDYHEMNEYGRGDNDDQNRLRTQPSNNDTVATTKDGKSDCRAKHRGHSVESQDTQPSSNLLGESCRGIVKRSWPEEEVDDFIDEHETDASDDGEFEKHAMHNPVTSACSIEDDYYMDDDEEEHAQGVYILPTQAPGYIAKRADHVSQEERDGLHDGDEPPIRATDSEKVVCDNAASMTKDKETQAFEQEPRHIAVPNPSPTFFYIMRGSDNNDAKTDGLVVESTSEYKLRSSSILKLRIDGDEVVEAGSSHMHTQSLTELESKAESGMRKTKSTPAVSRCLKTNSVGCDFVCDICGNHFTHRSLLTYHMRVHRNERRYECELCFKRFITSCNLSAHMRIHTGEKRYGCQYCERRFTDRSTSIKHERIHTNERPYTCKVCGKSFSMSSTLRRHEKIHVDDRPYKCMPCNKSFKLQHQYRAHLNTVQHKTHVEQAAESELGKGHP